MVHMKFWLACRNVLEWCIAKFGLRVPEMIVKGTFGAV